MPSTTPEYDTLPFIGRVTEALIEFQVMRQALATNGARAEEVVSFLSEHGLGDEASKGRVGRAAERLQNEGKLVEKNGFLKVPPDAQTEVRQVANLLAHLAPAEATRVGETGGAPGPAS